MDLRQNVMTHVRQMNHAYSDNHCPALRGLHKERTGIGPCNHAPGSMSECFQNASIVLVGMHPSCRMSSGATSLCSQDLCYNALGSHGRLHPELVSWCIEKLCQEAHGIDVRMHSESMSHNAFMSDCISMTPTSCQRAP